MSDSRQVTETQGQDLRRRAGGFRTTSSSSSASVSLQIITLYGGRSSVPVERSTACTLEKSGNKENTWRKHENWIFQLNLYNVKRDQIRFLPQRAILLHAAVHPAGHLLLDNTTSESVLCFCFFINVGSAEKSWRLRHRYFYLHIYTVSISKAARGMVALRPKHMKTADSPGCCSGSRSGCKLSCDSTEQTGNISPALPVERNSEENQQLGPHLMIWLHGTERVLPVVCCKPDAVC